MALKESQRELYARVTSRFNCCRAIYWRSGLHQLGRTASALAVGRPRATCRIEAFVQKGIRDTGHSCDSGLPAWPDSLVAVRTIPLAHRRSADDRELAVYPAWNHADK